MSSTEANVVIEPEGLLEEAVLEYLKAIDRGEPCRADELLSKYPQVAKELKEVFADEEQLDPFFSPIRNPTRNTSQDWTIDSPAMPAIPGYEILELYRKGGMGVVYKARQVGLDRIVALKMIRMDRPADAMTLARFEKEAQNLAQLHHPNIVGVYDSGKVGEQPYFVLEFVPGENLSEKIKESAWPAKAAAELMVCLADAMQYAHRINIIHRDLKPANILITPAGVPKIGDFGLSKHLENAAGLTHAGDCLGTPAYMPKEVAEGRVSDTGPGADIFGLGAILYELLTCRPPYEGETKDQVLRQAAVGKVQPPRQLRPAIPVALEKICLKALAPDPRQRYASASAMAEDLRNYLHPGRPIARGAAGLAVLMSAAVAAVVAWVLISPYYLEHSPGDVGPVANTDNSRKDGQKIIPTPPSPKELASQAKSILTKHCHRCHGDSGTIEGGLNYVLDRELLVQRGRIVPGEPNKSRLYKHVKDGIMPPKGEQTRPSELEVVALADWIKAGALEFNDPINKREFISNDRLLISIRADLNSANERDRPYYRYFTLTHLYNAGHTDDVLQTYRSGVAKLVNSLSWHPDISPPKPIDPAKTILRIDLRDYGWKQEFWKLLVDDYPFGIEPAGELGLYCTSATKSLLPYVRADWFVFAAARPPLYHQILELPDNALDLERKLGVDVLKNVAEYRVVRAGFNGSGISSNNRIIERHRSFFGAYYKSYDFASPEGAESRKNVFKHPLGPGPVFPFFQHDGGEIIFNLPNGLQAYLLVDAADKRIDKAPIHIVGDTSQKDKTVINGISCMNCHSRGIIEKDDEIHKHVQNMRAFPDKKERDMILGLYPEREMLAALMQKDIKRFCTAVVETGSHPSKTEPIFALASHYELELDLKQAAAEAGVTVDEFKVSFQRSKLARIFGPLQGGTIQRKVFEDNFATLIRELGHEIPKERLLTNSIGMKLKLIQDGKRAYFIGIYEVTQEQYKAVTGKNPSYFSATGDGRLLLKSRDTSQFPVERVSWDDAMEFCKALSKRENEKNRNYRLPTEAEWQDACCAGAKKAPGDNVNELPDYAWYEKVSENRSHRVGEKSPNALGLYDMHGNVKEWCDGNFQVNLRVLRGGAWGSRDKECQSSARDGSFPGFQNGNEYGFRIVLDVTDHDLRTIGQER